MCAEPQLAATPEALTRTSLCRAFFAVSVPLVLLAIVSGLLVVPAKGTALTVRLDVGLAWLAALSIFVLVPLDVASTLQGQQGQQQQQHRLGILWKVTYWYGFVAQFTLLPFHQVRWFVLCPSCYQANAAWILRCQHSCRNLRTRGSSHGLTRHWPQCGTI